MWMSYHMNVYTIWKLVEGMYVVKSDGYTFFLYFLYMFKIFENVHITKKLCRNFSKILMSPLICF